MFFVLFREGTLLGAGSVRADWVIAKTKTTGTHNLKACKDQDYHYIICSETFY